VSGMALYFVISLCDILCEFPKPHGERGDVCVENLSTARGTICWETVAKHDILL
jgi:hypothetical protein